MCVHCTSTWKFKRQSAHEYSFARSIPFARNRNVFSNSWRTHSRCIEYISLSPFECHACIPTWRSISNPPNPTNKIEKPMNNIEQIEIKQSSMAYLHGCQKISQNDIQKVKFQRILLAGLWFYIPHDIIEPFWLLCKHTRNIWLRNICEI